MTPLIIVLILSLMVLTLLLMVLALIVVGSWKVAQMTNQRLQDTKRRLERMERENRMLRTSLNKHIVDNKDLGCWQKITRTQGQSHSPRDVSALSN